MGIDRTDYPLLPDAAAVGDWEAVDFVDFPAAFSPGKPACERNSLWMVGVTLSAQNLCFFHVGGAQGMREQTLIYTHTDKETLDISDVSTDRAPLTQGVILRPAEELAARYCVACVEGMEYLFLEHKSGDYIYGGMRPSWYVFRRSIHGR